MTRGEVVPAVGKPSPANRIETQSMPAPEAREHIFVLRLWSEPRELEGAAPVWRGTIEHVPTRQRCYIKNLDEIKVFLLPYLSAMGVLPDPPSSRPGWLARWRSLLWKRRHE